MIKDSLARALPRRFYERVSVSTGPRFTVLLDERPLKTPHKRGLVVAGRELAEAIAAEWEAQVRHIDPASMPMTRLANTAVDRVERDKGRVVSQIGAFAASDLLCYRAGEPPGLVALQRRHWDPVLDWARTALGASLVTAKGVVHIDQPPEALAALQAALATRGAFQLAALHDMTTLTGSALLALAVAEELLKPGEAWTAAHVDEDWQILQWGEDEEAMARRRSRERDFHAACDFLRLAG